MLKRRTIGHKNPSSLINNNSIKNIPNYRVVLQNAYDFEEVTSTIVANISSTVDENCMKLHQNHNSLKFYN